MAENEVAVFQEILEISVDSNKFASDMDKILEIYSEKIKQMPNIGALNASEINESIQDIDATLNHLARTVGDTLGAVANQVTEQLDRMATNLDANTKRVEQSLNRVEQKTKNIKVPGEEQTAGGGGFFSSFVDGFSSKMGNLREDMGGLVAQALAFSLVWKAVNGLIEIALNMLAVIPNAIKEGFDYLNKFEQQSTNLQGVIAATVTYSKDIGENFRIAGKEAEAVVLKLQDISLKDHLDPTQMQKAFEALLEGGIAPFAKNMEQAVGLTEVFALAMKASGKDAQATRALISEIPKLLDGSIANSSKLLEVLHLNKDQWAAIRQEAMQHGNLLELLSDKMKPYLDATQQAALQQSVILSELDLMKQRVEAAIALPLWQELTTILQAVREWLMQHTQTLALFALQVGNVVKGFADMLIGVIKIGAAFLPWKEILQGVVGVVYLIGQGLAVVLTMFKGASDDFSDMMGTIFNTNNWKNGLKGFDDQWDQFSKRSEKRRAETTQKLLEEGKQINDFMTGSKTSAASQYADQINALLNKNWLGGAGPRDVSKPQNNSAMLQEVRDQMREEIDAAKNAQQAITDEVQRAERAKTISVREGEAQRIASYQNEYNAVVKAADKAFEAMNDIPGLKPEQRAHFISELNRTVSDAYAKMQKDVTRSQEAGNKESQDIDRVNYETRLKLAEEYRKKQLSLEKLYAQEGLRTREEAARAEAQAEEDAFNAQSADVLNQRNNVAEGTVEWAKLNAKLLELETQRADSVVINARKIADARKQDIEAMRQLVLLSAQLKAQEAEQRLSISDASPLQKRQQQKQIDQFNLDAAAQAHANAQAAYQDALSDPMQHTAEELEKLRLEAQKTADAMDIAAEKVLRDSDAWGQVGRDVSDKLFGFDFKESWDGANGAVGKMGVVAEAAAGALQSLPGIIGAIQQGYKQGGVFGAIGAGIGQFSSALSAIPVVGPFIGAIGGAFSMIGSLFTRAAKKIGQQIEKEIGDIMKEYQNGSNGLMVTIQKLQQERQDAINRLSGRRGGQDQLNQILPGLDDQIAQLSKQAQDIRTSFEQQLNILRQGSDVLQSWYSSWVDINKQVKDYIDAGGNQLLAQELIQLNYNAQIAKLKGDMRDGEQQAIQDAIQLNDLQKQKIDLINQEKQTEFDILTQDSLEKRQSSAIKTAQALAKQREDYKKSLDSLNQQVDLMQQRVAHEKTVFNISSDIATLHRRDEQLTLQALDEQLDRYRQMQQLISRGFNSAWMFPFGQFNPNLIPGINAAPPIVVQNTFHPGVYNPGAIAQGIQDRLENLMNRRLRSGMRDF